MRASPPTPDMAHDLRTAMHSIIGSAEALLRLPSSPPPARQHAKNILSHAGALLVLADRLLGAEGRAPVRIPFDLGMLLAAAAARAGLICASDPRSPLFVLGDPSLLSDCLDCLLGHAVAQGAVALESRLLGLEAGAARLRFSARFPGAPGQGLAEAAVRVRGLGSELRADGLPEGGSTWSFELDFVPEPFEPDAAAPSSPVKDILVVDDYSPNRLLARHNIERNGYRCVTADDGPEAIALCGSSRFDLILMDLQMPDMDGFETARRLRLPGSLNQATPILALTANSRSTVAADCAKAGFAGVVEKPFFANSFRDELGRWLGGVEAPPAAAVPPGLSGIVAEFGGNQALAMAALRQFVRLGGGQLELIRQKLADGDLAALGREAHKLRGAAANLRAEALATAAKAVEEASRAGQSAGLEELCAELFRRFAAFQTDVQPLL